MAISLVSLAVAQVTSLPLQDDPIYFGELALFFLGSIAVLFLAVLASALSKGACKEILQTQKAQFTGHFIIVFVVICAPITWISFAAQNAGAGIEAIGLSIIPIFTAGLALEERAAHVVAQAQREAKAGGAAGAEAAGNDD